MNKDLTQDVKINLCRITNLNVKSIILKLPENNMRLSLPFVGMPRYFRKDINY